jgi:hypothetical protein
VFHDQEALMRSLNALATAAAVLLAGLLASDAAFASRGGGHGGRGGTVHAGHKVHGVHGGHFNKVQAGHFNKVPAGHFHKVGGSRVVVGVGVGVPVWGWGSPWWGGLGRTGNGRGSRAGHVHRAGQRASAVGCRAGATARLLVVLLRGREGVLPVRAGVPRRLATRLARAARVAALSTEMTRALALAPLLAASWLGACAIVPTGPSAMALPGTGMSFDAFRADDAVCRQFAFEQVGGVTADQAAANAAVGSAAVGTALGAATGALIDGASGAGVGAGIGLLFGSMVGAGMASGAGVGAQRRYDAGYLQCMYAKGHKIPVSARYASSRRAQTYLPPPPPNTPPPPAR